MTITLDSYFLAFEGIGRPICLIDLANKQLVGNALFRELLGIKTENPLPVSSIIPNFVEHATEVLVGKRSSPDSTDVFLYLEKVDEQLLIGFAELGSDRITNFHSQRLKTLGMISGGVAHDFNNVLTGLLGHITYLKTVLPENGIHSESLQAIEEGSKKAAMLTQQILNFSRLKVVEKFEPINLNDLLQRTCSLLRGAVSPVYRLEFQVPNTPLIILGIEGKVAQVIVNLVMNAKAALRSTGWIRVTLELGYSSEAEPQKVAVLKVSDNGTGIPEELLGKIFEPFFSTKESGTGFGLSTVKRIISELNGSVDIKSKVDEGTTVTLVFPIAPDSQKPESTRTKNNLTRGNEKILIIDDEDPVRNVLSVSLRHLGYIVDTTSSGQEAISLFKDRPNRYDLVLLDMLMPELSGEEVFKRLRLINPNLRVLVISGYSSEESVQQILNSGGKGYIQKPFTIEDLSIKVRECLDSK